MIPEPRRRAVELLSSPFRVVWCATLDDGMASFWIRQGDTGRSLEVLLKDLSGADVAVPSGSTCLFRMVHQQTGKVVSGPAALSDGPFAAGSNNRASYPFSNPADTGQVGLYDAEWTVSYAGGGQETFPTRTRASGAAWNAQTSFTVEVAPRLGDPGLTG